MNDLIERQAAIDSIEKHLRFGDELYPLTDTDKVMNHAFEIAASCVYNLPSPQSEKTEYIPDTKAVPSKRDCVDLAERVTATFYDQEHEEWTQKSVTIADVLDSVCDDYTILQSTYPDMSEYSDKLWKAAYERGKAEAHDEIVRCKDCKWFHDIGCAIRIVDDSDKPSENDYCSMAERRTDE